MTYLDLEMGEETMQIFSSTKSKAEKKKNRL
jgi:hypothetical protein